MNFRLRLFGILLCSGFALTGCIQEPEVEESAESDLPPPPTAQQIAQEVITDANLDMAAVASDARFPVAARNTMLTILQAAKTEHSADEVGREGLEHVTLRLEKRIRDFREVDAWQYLLAFTDAYSILKPESRKYLTLRDEAYIQLKKPRVSVQMLQEMENRQLVMLTIYVPITDTTYKERVEIGDVIHGLKILSVFGLNRGVMVEYLETGERFVAYLPGAK